jgi:tetratricopeptide (TPR) repeat protein
MRIYALLLSLLLSPILRADEGVEDAVHFYKNGQYQRAVDVLSDKDRFSPDDSSVYLWLGRSYLKIHKWDDAVRELETAVHLEPSNALYHLWLGRACGVRASHSVFFTAFNWARRVVKEFETAQKLEPKNLDVRYDLLQYYLDAPGILGGGRDKAQAEVEAIAQIAPMQRATAQAAIYEKDKKWDLALKELTEATRKYPRHPDPYSDLAEFLLGRQDYEAAALNARRSLSLDGDDRKTRMILAAAEIRLQQNVPEAIKALKELAAGPLYDDDPTYEEVYYWLGEAHLLQGQMEKAREAFESSIAFNPDYDRAKSALSQLR